MNAFADFLRAGQSRAFAWGNCDCALWACDWIRQRRGIDPGAAFRGTYGTARQCARLLARDGGLLALAARAFGDAGLMAIAPRDAVMGDVACVKASFGETLGIVATPPRVALKSERGVIVSALHPILCAWRV